MPNYINKIKLPNNDVYEIQDANALPKTTQINGTSADSSTGNYTLTGDDIKLSSSYVVPQIYTPPVAGVTSVEDSIANLVKHVDDAVAGSVTSVDEAQNSHLDITTATGGAVTVDVADGYVIPSTTVGTPAESGTDVSLVSTGDMYTWNNKLDGVTVNNGTTDVLVKNTKLVAGSNKVTITPDATNNTITIDSTGTTYTEGTGIDIATGDVINNTGVLKVDTDNSNTNAANGTVTITKLNAAGTATEEVPVAVKGLSNAAYKDVDTIIDTTTPSTNLPTSAAVDTYVKNAISGITGPMIYKGGISVAADRALTVPQTVTSIKQGYTFKVTSSAVATIKVGDTFIADQDNASTTSTWVEDTDWTVVPSGDDEGKTYPCFTYIEETGTGGTVKYIGIDYGD